MSNVRILSDPLEHTFPQEWYEMATDGHFWLEWRFAAFRNQLKALAIPFDRRLKGLEIGCGHGVVRGQLEQVSIWNVDGADLNQEALELNGALRGETFFYNIHDRVKELEQAYDFVLLFDVLEHIDTPGPFLESLLFHLKPGGWLFINVPAFEALRSAYDTAVGHFRRYDRAMMRRELSDHPLEIRDLRYWGQLLVPLLLLRTLTTSSQQPTRQIIERGFQPPAQWINRMLVRIMRMETGLIHRPLLGTSLLAAAVRTA